MKVLIVGRNGFIAKSLFEYFSNDNKYSIYSVGSSELDFLNEHDVENYFSNKYFDILIFTAIYGGRRTKEDDKDIIDKNLQLFNSMIKIKDKFKLVFYFGSGASFDRNNNIYNYDNNMLGNTIPKDPYGYSKYLIETKIRKYDNIINLRIFNCFGIYEVHDRMIKANILNYINGNDLIIHQDKYFDFFFIEDLYLLICHYIKNFDKNTKREINCVYDEKLKLSDICEMINNLDDKKVNIKIVNKELGNSYCGKYNINFDLNFLGINHGLKMIKNNLV